MNNTLFQSTLKRNIKLFTAFTTLILFYSLVIMSMYKPNGESSPWKALPEDMKVAFGMGSGMGGLDVFMASGFYGVTFVLFMMIYCILVANQLISHLVDQGSMAYLLSTPVSRSRIAITQASVLVVNLFIITLLTTIVGFLGSQVMFKDVELNAVTFIQINMMGFLLFFFISGYSFLFSCLFNSGKRTLSVSALISVVFYGIHLVSNMNPDLEWLPYLTVLTAFQPTEIATGAFDVLPVALGLGVSGILLYVLAVLVIRKRNLPL